MIRVLGHDGTISRIDDGAVKFDDLIEKFKVKVVGSSEWTVDAWTTFLAKGGGPKKRFQNCLNPNSSKHFLYFRAIQGHSGDNLVDPTLQDNVLLPGDFAEYIYHIGDAHDTIIQGGLVPGGQSLKRDRQSVFFTKVSRWTTIKVWKKFCATWTSQGSLHTKILGNAFKILCVGAV